MSQEESFRDSVDGPSPQPPPADRAGVPEDELPPRLKSVEARLASLVPQTDRLSRDRLMFLAGQASVMAGAQGPGRRPTRWVWPAAFSASTVVLAASLLAVVTLRPAPSVVYVDRIVYRTATAASQGGVAPGRAPELPPQAPVGFTPPVERLVAVEPSVGPGLLASIGVSWPVARDRGLTTSSSAYLPLRDLVLSRGIERWLPPQSVDDSQRAAASYRDMLDGLLQRKSSDGPLPGRPPKDHSTPSGANS